MGGVTRESRAINAEPEESSADVRSKLKREIVNVIARLLPGLIFVVFGLNGFLNPIEQLKGNFVAKTTDQSYRQLAQDKVRQIRFENNSSFESTVVTAQT